MLKRLKQILACWVWAPLLGKAALWLTAFLALAHVGRGAAKQMVLGQLTGGPSQAPTARSFMAAITKPSLKPTTAGTKPPQAQRVGQACRCEATAAGAFKTPEGKLILNRAPVEALLKLPGIGQKRAAAIIALRSRLGRFRRLADLLRIKGIGFRSLRKLKPLVVLDAPRAAKP